MQPLAPNPKALSPKALNPKPLNPKTLSPKPRTQNPKPQTLKKKPLHPSRCGRLLRERGRGDLGNHTHEDEPNPGDKTPG